MYAKFVAFDFMPLRVIVSYPCRRLQTRYTITLMDDEELTILGLPAITSDKRYVLTSSMLP